MAIQSQNAVTPIPGVSDDVCLRFRIIPKKNPNNIRTTLSLIQIKLLPASMTTKSLVTRRLMATATFGAKKGLLSTVGMAAAVITVIALAPSEEFDDLDCQNHIFQQDCEHFKHK